MSLGMKCQVMNIDLLQLAPPYMGIELRVGKSLIVKAIADATGKYF